jgi:hypothetical protein
VGDTGGTEWVNPKAPTERIDIVSTGCVGCMQNAQGQWDVTSLYGTPSVQWTSVSANHEQGHFTNTSHSDPYVANGDPANPAHGHSQDPYVALGFEEIVPQPTILAIEVEAWAPASLARSVMASVTVRTPPPVQVRLVHPSAGAAVPADAPLTLSVSTTDTGGAPAAGTLAAYMISVPGSNPAWAKLAATSAGTNALRSITIPAASLFPAGCYYSSATSTCYNLLLMFVPQGKPVPAGGYQHSPGTQYGIQPLAPNPAAPPYPFARVSVVVTSKVSTTGA